MDLITLPAFKLGRRGDAEALAELLCSAAGEIGLEEPVCSAQKRDDLLNWIREKCYYSSVWTTDGYEALAILNRCARSKCICGIQYLVVRPECRRRGVGTAMVRHIQELTGVTSLIVEAQNQPAEEMLLRAGFAIDKPTMRGCPIRMTWTRF